MEQRRKILRARWSITNTYPYPNCNPNADAMRGEMLADAEAAPHSSAAAQSLRPK